MYVTVLYDILCWALLSDSWYALYYQLIVAVATAV